MRFDTTWGPQSREPCSGPKSASVRAKGKDTQEVKWYYDVGRDILEMVVNSQDGQDSHGPEQTQTKAVLQGRRCANQAVLA